MWLPVPSDQTHGRWVENVAMRASLRLKIFEAMAITKKVSMSIERVDLKYIFKRELGGKKI